MEARKFVRFHTPDHYKDPVFVDVELIEMVVPEYHGDVALGHHRSRVMLTDRPAIVVFEKPQEVIDIVGAAAEADE